MALAQMEEHAMRLGTSSQEIEQLVAVITDPVIGQGATNSLPKM